MEENQLLNDLQDVIKELNKFKDLQRRGLLLQLPCKIGEKVWIINVAKQVEEVVFTGVLVINGDELAYQYKYNFATKNIYLTKEDAEKAIRE